MSSPGTAEVVLFFFAGSLTTVGVLLWTGLYGVPHNGPVGFTMFVGGLVLATIFAAIVDGPLGEPGLE